MLDVNQQIKSYLFNEIQSHNYQISDIAKYTGLQTTVCLAAIDVDSEELITADTFTKFQEFFDNNEN